VIPASVSARRRTVADLALFGVTVIWGSTFVLVKNAVTNYPVFAFLFIRFLLAAAVLLPLAWAGRKGFRQRDLWAGALVGVFLFAGYALQTLGLTQTTAARAGFITGLCVVLVPVLAALIWRKMPPWQAWAGTALATAGLALLSLSSDLTMGRGDLLVLGAALALALHITSIGLLSPGSDPRLLTFLQIVMVALLSGLWVVRDGGLPPVPPGVWAATIFTAVAATALARSVQTAAQRQTTPTRAALIFSAEPAFSALFSVLFAGEQLSARGWLGCAIILAGVVLGALAQVTTAGRPSVLQLQQD
jgi:drug/metabolite transporter (DMT)-like permease